MATKKTPAKKIVRPDTLISPYQVHPQSLSPNEHVWDGKTLKPFSTLPADELEALYVCEWLDTIAAATEAGAVPQFHYVKALFGNEAVFRDFLYAYSAYDEEYRTHDRWWRALAALISTTDETAFVTSEEIADQLLEHAFDTGQVASR